jgi:hypothetical protein
MLMPDVKRLREIRAEFDEPLNVRYPGDAFTRRIFIGILDALLAPPDGAAGEASVPMPQNADQAAGMEIIGMAWLRENATDRLTDEGRLTADALHKAITANAAVLAAIARPAAPGEAPGADRTMGDAYAQWMRSRLRHQQAEGTLHPQDAFFAGWNAALTSYPKSAPTVPLPIDAAQAKEMWAVALGWLRHNAPEHLTEDGRRAAGHRPPGRAGHGGDGGGGLSCLENARWRPGR